MRAGKAKEDAEDMYTDTMAADGLCDDSRRWSWAASSRRRARGMQREEVAAQSGRHLNGDVEGTRQLLALLPQYTFLGIVHIAAF
jgi:hypothetical protein